MTTKLFYLVCVLAAASYAIDEDGCINVHDPILNIDFDPIEPRRQMENRRKQFTWNIINDFYGAKDVDSADKIVAEVYIQHNPTVADGRAALKAAAREWFKGMKKDRVDIRRIAADGDLVWIHRKWVDANGKAEARVDILRFDNLTIVEHWDVVQQIPEKSANDHPMF